MKHDLGKYKILLEHYRNDYACASPESKRSVDRSLKRMYISLKIQPKGQTLKHSDHLQSSRDIQPESTLTIHIFQFRFFREKRRCVHCQRPLLHIVQISNNKEICADRHL